MERKATGQKRLLARKHRPQKKVNRLRAFDVGEGYESVTAYRSEIQDMVDVLLGRKAPPIDVGVHTLHEVADAYYARGMEMQMHLHQMETDGAVIRGSSVYKFRTGELRDFIEMSKSAAELGSRRLTAEQQRIDQELRGYESDG